MGAGKEFVEAGQGRGGTCRGVRGEGRHGATVLGMHCGECTEENVEGMYCGAFPDTGLGRGARERGTGSRAWILDWAGVDWG